MEGGSCSLRAANFALFGRGHVLRGATLRRTTFTCTLLIFRLPPCRRLAVGASHRLIFCCRGPAV